MDLMISEALQQNLFGFAAALIGGISGGVFTLRATDKAIRDSEAKERRQEERNVQNLLDALGVEISALWNFHINRVGGMVERLEDGQALEFYYPLTQDYFTIYNSNAAHIGSIQDTALRSAIVICYNKCKKVVDGFKYNNELYRDYCEWIIAMATPDDYEKRPQLKAKKQALIEYAKIIKEDHFELKGYVENLLSLLEQSSKKVAA